ncbi:MAG: hypothetical protein ACRD0F_09005, partial [Acidimicrobiales bacterium]
AYGTPARASFLVGEVPAGAEPLLRPAPDRTTVADTAGLMLLTAILGISAIGLFAAGLSAFCGTPRPRRVRAAAPVEE